MKTIFLPFPRVCCFRAIEATQIVHLHTDSDSFQMPNIIFYAEKLIDLALFEHGLTHCACTLPILRHREPLERGWY